MSKFPQDGSTIVVESIDRTAYRWSKYKPDGARQMGKPGRWQKQVWSSGDWFKWENCEEPVGELSPPIEDGPISKAFKEAEGLHSQIAANENEISKLRSAINSHFVAVFMDGINEHGTHVIPSAPRSIECDDDILGQAEAIWAAGELAGFKAGDHIWCEFTFHEEQTGEYGQVELSSYWEFVRVDPDLSKVINEGGAA